MKKVLFILVSTLIVLSACSSEEEQNQEEVEQEPAFTEEDIALAKQMITDAHDLEKAFVEEANTELEKMREEGHVFDASDGNSLAKKEAEAIVNEFEPMLHDMVTQPFLDKYSSNIVTRESYEITNDILVSRFEQEPSDENTYKKIDEFEIFERYENLSLLGEEVVYHNLYDIHELIININEEVTTTYTDLGTRGRMSDSFTFYKTQDGDLLIGEFDYIHNNVKLSLDKDDEEVDEKVQEKMNELPPLQ